MSAMVARWLRRLIVGLLVGTPLLGGCTSKSANDAVSVTAVNYTGRELSSFLFIDPKDENKVAGGPPLTPYSGAGTMCCYSLPHRWKPGIKVKLSYKWFHDDDKPHDYEVLTVDIPSYTTDEPGVLWALFYEDGSVQVVASAVDPGHPKWPGKIKHWPVPSREYKLKLWQMDYDDAADGVRLFEQSREYDQVELAEKWKQLNLQDRDTKQALARIDGPSDPRFAKYLEDQRARNLAFYKKRVQDLLTIKP